MLQHRTINSFTQRPSWTQIFSYCVVLGEIIIFYVCLCPNYENYTAGVILSVLFGIATISLIVSTLMASIVDPSDPIVKEHKQARLEKKAFVNHDYLYCSNCDSYCHDTSKHCRACDRCVLNFDHHCIWINNCIGKSNYRSFMTMIVSAFLQLSLFLAGTIVLSLQRRFQLYLPQMITSWVYLTLVVILMFMDFNLILLHIYLNVKGITTFQMIMSMREEERMAKIKESNSRREEAERKRVVPEQETTTIKISLGKKEVERVKDSEDMSKEIPAGNNSYVRKDSGMTMQKEPSKQSLQSSEGKRLNHRYDLNGIEQRVNQQVQSVGQVSIFNVNDQQPPIPQEPLKVSKFFSKNKSLQFMISKQAIDQPADPIRASEVIRKSKLPSRP